MNLIFIKEKTKYLHLINTHNIAPMRSIYIYKIDNLNPALLYQTYC